MAKKALVKYHAASGNELAKTLSVLDVMYKDVGMMSRNPRANLSVTYEDENGRARIACHSVEFLSQEAE